MADCEIRAADGRLVQAGLRPNPEASIELENFAGSGTRRGFNSEEATLQVSQLVELGGKRAKRLQLAGAERDLSVWDKEAKRLAVITDL
ncbi:MAG: TolC family protein, partial [Gammaproteobacteria bacterium]